MLVFRALITILEEPIVRDHGYCPQDITVYYEFDLDLVYDYITDHGYCPQEITSYYTFDNPP